MTTENDSDKEQEAQSKKPDEYSGMYIRGFLKITDPDSGQVIVETAN